MKVERKLEEGKENKVKKEEGIFQYATLQYEKSYKH